MKCIRNGQQRNYPSRVRNQAGDLLGAFASLEDAKAYAGENDQLFRYYTDEEQAAMEAEKAAKEAAQAEFACSARFQFAFISPVITACIIAFALNFHIIPLIFVALTAHAVYFGIGYSNLTDDEREILPAAIGNFLRIIFWGVFWIFIIFSGIILLLFFVEKLKGLLAPVIGEPAAGVVSTTAGFVVGTKAATAALALSSAVTPEIEETANTMDIIATIGGAVIALLMLCVCLCIRSGGNTENAENAAPDHGAPPGISESAASQYGPDHHKMTDDEIRAENERVLHITPTPTPAPVVEEAPASTPVPAPTTVVDSFAPKAELVKLPWNGNTTHHAHRAHHS